MTLKITKLAVFPMLFLLWSIFGNPQAASAAHSGFAWSNNAASALNVPYTPNPLFAYNSTGGAVTITRTGTGLYLVTFVGLGATSTGATGAGSGGNAQVSSYNSALTNKYSAKITKVDSLSSDFNVSVRTQRANGLAGNEMFSVLVTVP